MLRNNQGQDLPWQLYTMMSWLELENFSIRDLTNKVGEVSYIVNPDYWNKGIATEATTMLIDFGFNQHQLHRIFATCDPRNIGSLKVLEKVGMVLEGRIRENLFIKYGWRDSLLYSVLEYEWKM